MVCSRIVRFLELDSKYEITKTPKSQFCSVAGTGYKFCLKILRLRKGKEYLSSHKNDLVVPVSNGDKLKNL